MSILQGDSLLSNISNISVKIENNKHDGPQFFRNQLKCFQGEVQVKAQQLPDDIIDLGYYADPPKQSSHLHQQQMRWIQSQSAVNPHGFSEEQQDQNQPNHPIQQQDLRKQMKNQTKNIPKNYGKAIISFIEKYKEVVNQITKAHNVNYNDIIQELKLRKKNINTIADLRNLWVQHKYSKCMRVLSNLFLRKYALQYIFNSRICNYGSHIKYRHRLRQAIQKPNLFKHIKDY